MRSSLAFLLALTLFPAATRGADDPKAIIEKAIQARGGAAILDKYPAGRIQSKGTIRLQGTDYPYTSQSVYFLPDRLRSTVEVVTKGNRNAVTQVFSGNRLSIFVGGLAQEVPSNQFEETRTTLYIQNITRLTPLLKDKSFKLAGLEEKTVESKPVVGVRVSSEGARDVKLYFDKESGLPVLIERRGFDAAGKAVDQEELYSDFREANGLKYPTKTVVRQGDQRYLVSETTEFKPVEKVDAREFYHNP